MRTIVSTNPSNYENLGEVTVTTTAELQEMLTQARSAQFSWSQKELEARGKQLFDFYSLLKENKDEIAATFSSEMGMPIDAARAEVSGGLANFDECLALVEQALNPTVIHETDDAIHRTVREPLGVVSAIGPWNFPFANFVDWMWQVVLPGNALIYKPSEEIILFGALLQRLVSESTLPHGLVNVVLGDGNVGAELAALETDLILFTGSVPTAQKVTEIASRNSVRVLTELGGSAPGVVFEDADIAKIIESVYDLRFANSGQYCDNLKRLIVHEDIVDSVLESLVEVNSTKSVGPASQEVDFGPLVAKRQLDRLIAQYQDALEKGATVYMGGRSELETEGAFFNPTVLTDVTFDMKVWNEEVFGPLLPVVTFSTEEEAIQLANDTSYGLGAYVFTEDPSKFARAARGIAAGNVTHNNVSYYNIYCPFGGFKQSGNTRTGGLEGVFAVTQIKTISTEK